MTYSTPTTRKAFYGTRGWLEIRKHALRRDNYECQECKRNGLVKVDSKREQGKRKEKVLEVHHIKDIETHPELALELDNLETLCISCHNKVHERFQIKNKVKKWDDERW